MAELRVIGAGLPRTGTTSLKIALEQLLDGPCYHMTEFNERFDDDEQAWLRALDGEEESLAMLMDGWVAAVDWPASLLSAELAAMYPDAIVVLSHRASADEWWSSISSTVWANIRQMGAGSAYQAITSKMFDKAGLGADWDNPDAAKRLYLSVISEVRQATADHRLVIWQPGDGWEPLCAALELPVPTSPFPHDNTRAEFRDHSGLDQ